MSRICQQCNTTFVRENRTEPLCHLCLPSRTRGVQLRDLTDDQWRLVWDIAGENHVSIQRMLTTVVRGWLRAGTHA